MHSVVEAIGGFHLAEMFGSGLLLSSRFASSVNADHLRSRSTQEWVMVRGGWSEMVKTVRPGKARILCVFKANKSCVPCALV